MKTRSGFTEQGGRASAMAEIAGTIVTAKSEKPGQQVEGNERRRALWDTAWRCGQVEPSGGRFWHPLGWRQGGSKEAEEGVGGGRNF